MQSNQNKRRWRWAALLSGACFAGSLAIAQTQPPYSQNQGGAGAPGTAAPSGSATPSPSASASPTASPTASPSASGSPVAQQNIMDVLIASGQYTTLVQAIRLTGLEETLRGPGPLTLFAPNDQAFSKLDPALRAQALANPDLLKQVLQYHIAPEQLSSQQLSSTNSVTTEEGEAISVSSSGGSTQVNDANIVQPDIQASNGVIQGIDTVLIPPSLASAAQPSPSASASASASPSASPSVSPSASS